MNKLPVSIVGLIASVSGLLITGPLQAADVVVSMTSNGYLSWNNVDSNLFYTVEARPNLSGTNQWDGVYRSLQDIQSGEAVISVPVGLFYRVTGSPTSQHTRTLSPTNATLEAGYYEATSLAATETNLLPANIRSGVTIFGVQGAYPAVTTPQVFLASGMFVVPAGVSELTVTASGEGGLRGLGAAARAVLAVTPGETLQVNVDVGGGAGGFDGVAFWGEGPDGHGASDVRRTPFGLADRLLVGGGAGGDNFFGGGYAGGGSAGGGPSDAWWDPFSPGAGQAGLDNFPHSSGGTQSAGGTGGGGAGGFGVGGTGGIGTGPAGFGGGREGAGGGGGWYGGAGGSGGDNGDFPAGAGGGGSSYGPPGATFSLNMEPAASVVIEYVPSP
jgi:hypothetical protein